MPLSESPGDNGIKRKRTRGPRSCLECRSAKQRCEQLNFADIIPSSEPQPLEFACRRCRVLRLACVVPDQLPKSTRLRIERSKGSHASTSADGSSFPRTASVAQPSSSVPLTSMEMHPLYQPQHKHHPTTQSSARVDAIGSGYGDALQGHASTQQSANAHVPTDWAMRHPDEARRSRIHSQPQLASQQADWQTFHSQSPLQHAPSQSAPGHTHLESHMDGHLDLRPQRRPSMNALQSSSSSAHATSFTSPESASAQGRLSGFSRSPSSNAGRPFASDTPSAPPLRFDASIFDPMPVIKSIASAETTTKDGDGFGAKQKRPSLSSHAVNGFPAALSLSEPGPVVATALLPPRPLSGTDSPHSQSSGSTSNMIKEPSWFYRARIACRPMQLLEHLVVGPPSEGNDDDRTYEASVPNISQSPPLEQILRSRMTQERGFWTGIERRWANIQNTLPFMPSLQSCKDSFPQGIFLLAVIVHLEGGMPLLETQLLHDHLTVRCIRYASQTPESLFDICALLTIANLSPFLLRAPALAGVVSGSSLIASALRAAKLMSMDTAPSRLGSILEGSPTLRSAAGRHNETFEHPTNELDSNVAKKPLEVASFPRWDSTVVQHAFCWMYLNTQELILEMFDVPTSLRIHPQTSDQKQKEAQFHANARVIDRYCRAMIDAEPDASVKVGAANRLHLFQLATMLVLVYSARTTEAACQSVRSFHIQFEEQVRQMSDSSSRVTALRRWTDQAIESLGVNMSNARDSLRKVADYLGSRSLANDTHLKYIELSLAALEFSSLCHLKDKLYVAGHELIGMPNSSQEFLFAIFARPQLLKSYESLGVVRGCVAKHVLMLLTNLGLDLRSTKTRDDEVMANRSGRSENIGPLDHWGPLAHVFPLARWCGVLVGCATVLVEELAGRFLAQEAPWGAMGESRLELYTMLVRQTYDILKAFERDASMRHTGVEQAKFVTVTLYALDKHLTAMATWRKRASGIGVYIAGDGSDRRNLAIPIQVEVQQNSQTLSTSEARPAVPYVRSSNFASLDTAHQSNTLTATRVEELHANDSTVPNPLDQVYFGDALLHDILFTPIEQFFGESG